MKTARAIFGTFGKSLGFRGKGNAALALKILRTTAALVAILGTAGGALALDGVATFQISLPTTQFARLVSSTLQPVVLPPVMAATGTVSDSSLSGSVSSLPAPGALSQTLSATLAIHSSAPSYSPVIIPPIMPVSPAQVLPLPTPSAVATAGISHPPGAVSLQPTLTPVGLSTGAGGSGGISPVITWPPPWPPAGQSQIILPPAAVNGLPSLASREQLGLTDQ